MARTKQVSPTKRADSSETMQTLPDIPQKRAVYSEPVTAADPKPLIPPAAQSQSGVIRLIICVSGIYASFLSWGLLQERITTTPYTPEPSSFTGLRVATEYFRFPIFLNTIQSLFAFISGSIYLITSTGTYSPIPKRAAILPLLLVSLTTTLASPFGYAALAHVDYLTFVLAKSCKLLPVMALHITLFRKRYPLSKYLVVVAVTAGVAIFTIYYPPKPGKVREARQNSTYGLILLGINLLFDGLTNTVQDHIFSSPSRYGSLKGPQMMVVTNAFSTVIMALYLGLTPHIPVEYLASINVAKGATNELTSALAFLQRHPSVLQHVLGFAACGAIGQLFIFETLQRFSSLLLVTVTVTRKMLTMVLSVVWYGKSLTVHQWGGVGLVFGGIGTEAYLAKIEKQNKTKSKSKSKTK